MRQQVNLYQPMFRKQEKKFSAKAMLQSMAVTVVGIAALFAWTQWRVIALKSESARADQQQAAATKRLSEVTQQFGGKIVVKVTVDEEIARLEQRVAAQQQIREILNRGLFTNTQGFSGYFAAFARQHSPEVWLTGFNILGAADQMTLQGRSSSPEAVPRYVQKLAAERRLAGIEFQVFQMTRSDADPKKAAVYIDFTLRTAGAASTLGKTP